ncbi:MAG: hypothetical protein BGP06_16380 [Rhizobiales bacterium 65-9]|nr:hypothetical protein [Hyphomicrobiales bacterium]OJY38038.1 MAG: hypothetical protein BGP06_16380 [Rhizobiales bacterium 65-9]
MSAELLLRERHVLAEDAFVDIRIWRVPRAVRGSRHEYKYALAYIIGGECVLRYDNEAGKGDHRHANGEEFPYAFTSPENLIDDFWRDVGDGRPA